MRILFLLDYDNMERIVKQDGVGEEEIRRAKKRRITEDSPFNTFKV